VRRHETKAVRRGLSAAALAVALAACGSQSTADRQAEVAERGAEVMPFDLDATTHRFTKDDLGGVQTVVADDPTDLALVGLVRDHLREEATKFRSGDYADPARIHGADMPGVAELAMGYERITVGYADVPQGGSIRYESDAADLVDAIHAWFDRQVHDHGKHATSG
jgi:hypothetical protein